MSTKQAKRASSNFSFIASHELKAPLAAMKWFLNMLMKGDIGPLTPDQEEIIDEIYKNNDQMIDLIDNLSDVEALIHGNLQLQAKKFNLTQTLTHLLDQMSVFAKARNVTLKLNMQHDMIMVNADEKRVRDTMHNFVNNAIKYTPGKGEVHIALQRMSSKELNDMIINKEAIVDKQALDELTSQEFAVFQVTDSGIGISSEQKKEIFQKFFRSDEAIKMNTRGTGLGLFIDKIVMNLSQGLIWFYSVEKKGSTFAFALPLLDD